MTPGKMLLRGHITSSDSTVKVPRNAILLVEDVFTDETKNQGIKIDSLGNFEEMVSLPHAGVFWLNPIVSTMCIPGDTVSIEYDMATKDMKIEGPEGYQRFYDNYLREDNRNNLFSDLTPSWNTDKMSREELQEYIHTIIKRLDKSLGGKDVVLEDIADEFIRISPIVRGIEIIEDVNMKYKDRASDQYASKTVISKKDIDKYWEERRKSSLDLTEVYDFLSKKYPNSTINNPVFVVCSDNSRFMVNRIEHEEYISLRTDGVGRKTLDNIEKVTGFPIESLLTQVVICRDHASGLNRFAVYGNDRPYDYGAYGVRHTATFIPLVTEPRAASAVANVLRNFVKKHEGKTDDMKPVPNSLRSLTDPYEGNVLLVDFWGIGCGPCRFGMLNQREYVDKMADKPVKFLYVAKEEERTVCEEWMEKNNIKGEHVYISEDHWRLLESDLNFSAIPFTIVVKSDRYIPTINYTYEIEKLLSR